MKILFFSAQYLPTVGGVERYTDSLTKILAEKGHSVAVVTSALPGLPYEDKNLYGADITRLPTFPVMNGRFPVLKYSRQLKAFIKDFAENPPDFCVIQTRFYTQSIMAAKLCKKYKVPAIVIEHGTAHLIRGGVVGFAGNIYEHIACRYVYKCCNQFYGVSPSCCNWLKHFGIDTEKVLYNSVDINTLENNAYKGKTGLMDKLPQEVYKQTKIVFSARFVREKGVKQLISAFEKIRKEYPDTALIMAGDGPLWEETNRVKIPGVILTGRLSYEENLALIEYGDIFCLPTFSEGFATTVLEAAALKTYIITTPTGGSPQLIPDETYGRIIPDMSRESIYQGLKYTLENIEKLNTATAKTFSLLEEQFTWEKTADKLEQIAMAAVKK